MDRPDVAVYVMANARPTLYVGVTSNLPERVMQHKCEDDPDCFTARYHLHRLVYFERFDSIAEAIRREKVLKKLTRARKLELIRRHNPSMKDLKLDEHRGRVPTPIPTPIPPRR